MMRAIEIDIYSLLDVMYGIVSDGDLDIIVLNVPVSGK